MTARPPAPPLDPLVRASMVENPGALDHEALVDRDPVEVHHAHVRLRLLAWSLGAAVVTFSEFRHLGCCCAVESWEETVARLVPTGCHVENWDGAPVVVLDGWDGSAKAGVPETAAPRPRGVDRLIRRTLAAHRRIIARQRRQDREGSCS